MIETSDRTARPSTTRAARAVSPKVANTYLAGGGAFAAAHALGLFGPLSVLTLPLLVAGSVAAIGFGLARNRPPVRWPWFAFLACTLLFVVGSAMRDIYPSLGVVGPERSLMPDLFAMPGYLLYAAALLGLLYYQRAGRGSAGSVIEASILALSGLLIVWACGLTPLLDNAAATFTAKVAISAYVPVSLFLVAIAAKLAFVPDPSVVHRYLLGLVASMLAGDVMYFLFELGVLDHKGIADGPYALASVFLAAAALHPSMASPPSNTLGAQRKVGGRRLALVAFAMFIPVAVLLVAPPVNGFERAVMMAVSLVLVGLVAVRVLQALREQQRYEEELAFRADHDSLTGLPNRTFLLDQVNRMLTEHPNSGDRGVALVFLDVDQFKLINDSLGHLVGDQLLVSVAKHLQGIVREHDIVARVSGDEFVIAMPLTTADDAVRLAERVRASFEAPLPLGPSHTYLTVSIGLVFAQDDTVGALELVRDADTAMYRSKDAGRDQVTVFDDEMRKQVSRRVNLEGRLRNAVDRGEMTVHYQPIITLPSGEVEGFEALMRWEPPGEKVFPDEFIPVAEESGLIVPLGEWILNEACSQLAAWRQQFPQAAGLTMSVNLSVRQLREPNLLEVVAGALDAAGLPGDALNLEITESVIMDDTEANIAKLVGLRRMGVRLSVDDFGTGFSSLSYLKKFPIDRVKIDRSFVASLGEDAPDAALVRAIIAMSAALDLDTIAEGIEEPHQAEMLHQLGCSHAQGYMYSRPIPAADIPDVVCRLGVAGAANRPQQVASTAGQPVGASATGAASRPAGATPPSTP